MPHFAIIFPSSPGRSAPHGMRMSPGFRWMHTKNSQAQIECDGRSLSPAECPKEPATGQLQKDFPLIVRSPVQNSGGVSPSFSLCVESCFLFCRLFLLSSILRFIRDSFEIHPRFIRKAFRFRQVSHEKENNPANRMTAFFSLFGFSTFSYSSRVQASLRFSESSAASGICSHLASSISVLIHLNGIDQTSLPLFRVISCFSAAF